MLDHVLNGLVGNRLSIAGGITGGKEILEWEDAVGCADKFIGNRTTDGGFVHFYGLCDRVHGEGAQLGDALFKEVILAIEEFSGDAFECLLPLLDGID